jgi:hypothetical protein
MNNLTGLIPILYAALQIVSRELVGLIPATSRNMTANGAALNQIIRVPVTPESTNQDITPGTPPANGGTNFDFVDMAITKNRIAKPIVWNGDEQISVGAQLNQMMVNQYAQAMRGLVNEVERDTCYAAVIGAAEAGNVYGTAGITPFPASTGLADLAQIKKLQDDLGTPIGDRHLVINTATGAALRSLEKLTNVDQAGENDMLRRGVLSNLMGYAVRESGGYMPLDPGTATGITLSAGAAAGAEVFAVTALGGTINPGALISLAGNYYTVTAPALAGATSINISPKVKEDITSGAAGTIIASYLPNVAFSRDFIYLITRTPAMPNEGDNAKDILSISDPVSGLSFQVVLYGDYRQVRIEIGLAWGVKAVNKRHGALLLG